MKRKFLTILLVVLLTLSLVVGLVACVTIPKNEEYEDKGEFITNGNFTATSTTTDFPRSPSSWSGEAGSSSSDNATETDSDALVSGVINTRDDFYKAYSNNWGKLKNPSKVGEGDDQILMVYNKKMTAYGYRSNNISLKQNKYYKLDVSVRTDNIKGAGAYVFITGDGGFNKEFAIGNTNGQWQTVTVYLETSKASSSSLKVGLFNGKNGKNDGNLSQGYAFFDNAVMEEITSSVYNDAVASANVAKLSAAYGDTEFANTSGTSNVYTAAAFTNSYSTGNNGSAPTGTDYLERGIVDTNNNPPSSLPENYDNGLGATDGKFLFINNKELTAFGYRSNTAIRFERGNYYRIDIKLATFIDPTTSLDTGANIRLMTSSSKDDTVSIIENIRTNGEWITASFYIKGDSMRNKDLYIEFDLGSGGKNDNHTLVKGQLMVDNFTVLLSDESEFNNKLAGTDVNEAAYSLDTWAFDESENILSDANKGAGLWAEDKISYSDFSPSGGTSANKGLLDHSTTGNWNDLLGANPGSYNGSDNADVIAMLNANSTINYRALYKDSARLTSNDGYYHIAPNNYYRIGMWVKTRDIAENKGLTVSLMQYDNSKKNDPTTTEISRHSTLQTISNFNSDTLEDSSEYTELVFYVEGDLIKDKYVYLAFKLGSGTFLTPSSFVKGSAYISGITMFNVSFSDYSSETGDYVKQQSFKASSGSITNGNFDSINNQTTLNYYESDELKALDYSQGYLSNAFGVPSSWTNTNESTLKKQLNAGIFNTQATALREMLNDGKDTIINFDNSFYNGFESYYKGGLNNQTNPNVLVIDTKVGNEEYKFTTATPTDACGCTNQACKDQGYCDGKATGCATAESLCLHHAYNGRVAPFGFKSSSISLSANSYYMISVWAKASRGAGSIRLSTTNKENDQIITFNNENAANWTRFDFYIETGFDSTTATLELFLGEAGSANEVEGTVFFDIPQLTSIDEVIYDAAEKKYEGDPTPVAKVLTYTVNSFDNATQNEDSLDTPTGWTGAQEDSEKSPHETSDYVAGVYNFDHGNRDWLGKDGDNTISADVMAQILSSANPNALVINNNVATEYNYTYSLSKSLNTESYYKISIKVLTYNLTDNTYATISLKLNNLSYTFSNDADKSIKVNHNLEWHEYSFYIKTPTKTTISTTNLMVALGTKNNLVKGYAFFDDLTIAKINEEEFNAAVPVDDEQKPAEGYNTSDELRIVFTEEDAEANPPVEKEETDPLLWLYISSGILGGLIVLVMLAYLFKWLYTKYTKPWLEKRKRQNLKKNRTGDRNKNVYTPKNKDKFND